MTVKNIEDPRQYDPLLINETAKKTTPFEKVKEIVPLVKKKASSAFTKKTLYKKLPFLGWIPTYDKSCALGDFLAGVTVGLMVIPQGLAYSGIAGLPTQYGLYGSFLGAIVYIFFGSCKDVPMGPTAISALLTFQAVKGLGAEHAILLCFFTGVVQFLMGLFGLGFLIDFISGPVSSGFTSAVALIILTSQVKDILGIHAAGSVFTDIWRNIFKDIHNTNVWDTVLGICCIAVLLIMRIIGQFKLGPSKGEPSTFQAACNKFLWLFSTARNAIIVIVCGFIGYSFYVNGESPLTLIGNVPPGLPSLQPPPFGYTKTINETEIHVSFFEMMSNLGTGIIVTPLIGLLETIAICKAFSNGKPVDATQELIAIGLANIANSFVQAFPGAGALARSAVNNSSGVKTPMGGLYTGLLVILALLFFTPFFYFIPKAALAAIIIAAVIFMVEVKVVKPMWRSKKSDLFLGVATFVACLVLPLEIGILVGIGLNLLFILYHAARPKISIEKLTTHEGTEYLILTPDRCLIFPSTDYVRNLVTKHSIRQGIPVVIDCTHIYGADYTAATVVGTLTKDFAARGQPLFFYNLKPSVSAVFEGLSPTDFVVYYDHDQLDDLLRHRELEKTGGQQHIV
ncbi:sodium-independent sulfate anion transporter-like isoform X2 [Anthonomus grandis grandis]|uniref:sodium-independent sulfate anion transporter-like isoform X2 n=1 Tax=Anthonomus grandis grandis TaxID=2921223 RepID=UPI0021661B12|nr:sodium-independent sulfate anion transporter-like isoform X2 [Anthonomus grandis grandis]